jgi:hypothetical protein
LRDHLKEAAPRRMIFSVGLKVLGQMLDPASEKCDLHVRAAGIFVMQLKLLEAQRFGALCHNEAATLDEEPILATAHNMEAVGLCLRLCHSPILCGGRVGRGGGVGRTLGAGVGRCVGLGRGVAVTVGVDVGVIVAVAVGVDVAVAVDVAVTVAVAVAVGVGDAPDCAQYLPPVFK